MSNTVTLFLSNQEIKNIKNFYHELGVNPSHLFEFDGPMYCSRTYVDVIGEHDTLVVEEDGVRIKGLGKFYPEDED